MAGRLTWQWSFHPGLADCSAGSPAGRSHYHHGPGKQFFPPAAAALGINLNNLLLIQAASCQDEFWALDQALRCPAVAAVWAPLKHIEPRRFRRLQLAVEQSGSLGLFTRPLQVRGQPSWSQIQLWVQPRPGSRLRRWRIEVVRARGDRAGRAVELEMDDTTGTLRESSH